MIKALYQTSDGKIFSTQREAKEYEARKLYTVTYTMSGSVCVRVYAKNEDDAHLKADEMWCSDDIDWDITEVEVEEG